MTFRRPQVFNETFTMFKMYFTFFNPESFLKIPDCRIKEGPD